MKRNVDAKVPLDTQSVANQDCCVAIGGQLSLNVDVQIELAPQSSATRQFEYDLDRIIYNLDKEINFLSSHADEFDYLISIASGVLCVMLDILWVGEFSFDRGYRFASDKVDAFVTKTAKMMGCKANDLSSAVKFLELKFPIPSDGNTPQFSGGLQHHLRDFAHHPTIAGLIFSLLTQFTGKSYGTDVNGLFIIVDVPEKSREFIGEDIPTKIIYGTITWFFHLISNMASSSNTAGKNGGTGIPGPLLALAKELSALPVFRSVKVGDNSLSVFLSKLFNDTLLADHDASGAILKDTIKKFDLRGELGVGAELIRQAVPVVANECIVRCFYFIRHLALELRVHSINSFSELKQLDWRNILPANSPTIARMLTIATGVFTTVDIGEAVISQKYFISVNHASVGRFTVAIGEDISWCLAARNLKAVRAMYEDIQRYAFTDNRIYDRIGQGRDIENLG